MSSVMLSTKYRLEVACPDIAGESTIPRAPVSASGVPIITFFLEIVHPSMRRTAPMTPANHPMPHIVPVSIGITELAASAASPCIETRSEEHTSELQSQSNLVCRLLLEKKK